MTRSFDYSGKARERHSRRLQRPRFARNTYDDIVIAAEPERLGVEFVSATEHFDQTLFGKRVRRYAAAYAEFYSESLSVDVKRRLHKKAWQRRDARTGTAGISQRPKAGRWRLDRDGRDRPRAQSWAFVAYATGAYTLDTLHAALEKRGLRTRRTREVRERTYALVDPGTRRQLNQALFACFKVGAEGEIEEVVLDPAFRSLTANDAPARLRGGADACFCGPEFK